MCEGLENRAAIRDGQSRGAIIGVKYISALSLEWPRGRRRASSSAYKILSYFFVQGSIAKGVSTPVLQPEFVSMSLDFGTSRATHLAWIVIHSEPRGRPYIFPVIVTLPPSWPLVS